MKIVKSNLPNNGNTSEMQSQIDSLQKHLDRIAAGNKELEKNLEKFDTLDFQVTGIINRSDFNVGALDPFDISTDVMIKADGEFFKQ
jgi:hypothetical protein